MLRAVIQSAQAVTCTTPLQDCKNRNMERLVVKLEAAQ